MSPSTRVVGTTLLVLWACLSLGTAHGQVDLPDARLVPRVQVVPLPGDEVSFQVDGREFTRYHFGGDHKRPFLYPVNGPSGRSLTRMGHPRDPVGHSHHNSVWISHQDVDGENFWEDAGAAGIVHRRILRFDDGDESAGLVAENVWFAADGVPRLTDRRAISLCPIDEDEWLLLIDLELVAEFGPTTLGPTAFGPIGVRMAKSIGVNDGGGLIRNSEGQVNEQGENGVFRKPARWVDYSGPIVDRVAEGITLFDHPENPGHPNPFHVRADGWMGASPGLNGPITIEPGRPLRLRYGLLVHGGVPQAAAIDARWREFAELPVAELPEK